MLQLTLAIHPSLTNAYPVQGVLLRGEQPTEWLATMSALGLDPSKTPCYPIPGQHPGQIWGAVLWASRPFQTIPTPYQGLQLAHGVLLLPEQTELYPALAPSTLRALLHNKRHFLHPTLGWVELFEPVDWQALLRPPAPSDWQASAPMAGIELPQTLRYLTVSTETVQDSLDQLDQAVMPDPETAPEPLTPLEKRRLEQLRRWRDAHQQPPPKSFLGKLLQRAQRPPDWTPELEAEWQALEDRQPPDNEQLFDWLQNDPEKGLAYAPPLNDGALGRGPSIEGKEPPLWSWMPRWLSTSLDQNGNRQSGRYQASNVGEALYERLRRQYQQTARDLAAQGKYDKAAFVYLRLLKQPLQAVEMLEKGQLYAQAASVCLEYLNDTRRAAQNAARAQQWERALQLYLELKDPLEIGRIYEQLDQPRLARQHYETVVKRFMDQEDYYEAAEFVLKQFGDKDRARAIYYQGWHSYVPSEECLDAYLATFETPAARQEALEVLYAEGIPFNQELVYMRTLLACRAQKSVDLAWLEQHAFQLVADHVQKAPALARYLLDWQPKDRHLGKDVLRYRRQDRRQRKRH